jgi:hypothetical protein
MEKDMTPVYEEDGVTPVYEDDGVTQMMEPVVINGQPQYVQSVDEMDVPIFETKPGKDCLTIDSGDVLGVALACIKSLKAKIDLLEARVATLEAQ